MVSTKFSLAQSLMALPSAWKPLSSEQMIDKYGMEVEDVDDFLDAFVSRT